jgi:hypothetical protein
MLDRPRKPMTHHGAAKGTDPLKGVQAEAAESVERKLA